MKRQLYSGPFAVMDRNIALFPGPHPASHHLQYSNRCKRWEATVLQATGSYRIASDGKLREGLGEAPVGKDSLF